MRRDRTRVPDQAPGLASRKSANPRLTTALQRCSVSSAGPVGWVRGRTVGLWPAPLLGLLPSPERAHEDVPERIIGLVTGVLENLFVG